MQNSRAKKLNQIKPHKYFPFPFIYIYIYIFEVLNSMLKI